MTKPNPITTSPNQERYFKSYNYARVYLFVGAVLTIILSNLSANNELVKFNYTIQLILAFLYVGGFLFSNFNLTSRKYLFSYTFIIVTLSSCSVTYILFENNFSVISFLLFIISMLGIIFIINTKPRLYFFVVLFSLVYISSLIWSEEIIIGQLNAIIIYVTLLITAYFVVNYRVGNTLKGKTKQKVFDYFFKYSSDILLIAKIEEKQLVIGDFNDKFQDLIGATNRHFLLKSPLNEIEINGHRLFKNIDFTFQSLNKKIPINDLVYEVSYNAFYVKESINYFISIKDVSVEVREALEEKLTIDSYKFLFENSSELICISEVDGTVVEYNTSLSEKLGYDSKELIGSNLSKISVNEDKEKRLALNKKIFENGGFETFRKIIRTKNGKEIPVETILRKGKYFDKEVLISTSRDISERLQTEKRLRENERFLNQLYQSAPVMMYTENKEGIIMQVNELFLKVTGYEENEILGRTFDNFLTVDYQKKYADEKGLLKESKYVLQCKNNEVRNVLIDSIGLKQKSEYGYLNLYVVHDVTELYTYQKVLANSVERFTNLFENAPIAMAIATQDDDLLDFNKSFIELLGYSEDELLQLNIREITHIDDHINLNKELDQLKIDSSYTSENKFIRKDGSIVYTLKKVILDADEYQQTVKKIIQIVDITSLIESRMRLDRKQEILDLTLASSKTILWDLEVSTGNAIWRNIKEVTGFDEETLIVDKELFKKFVHPDDYAFVIESIREVIRLKKSYAIDFRLIKKDGEVLWINSRGEVKLDDKGNPTNIYGVMQDITQDKEYEKALELSELKYKQLFQRNLLGIYRTTFDGRVIDCNPAFARIMGYDSVEEMLSYENGIHFYPNRKTREELLNQLIEKKTILSKRIELLKKDKSTIHILLSASVIFNSNNEIDYIEGNIIDIDDLVKAERNLELSRQQYKNLIDQSSFGILIVFENEIQFINTKGLSILKYRSEKEVINKKIDQVIGLEDSTLFSDIKYVNEGNSFGTQDRVFINNEDKRLNVETRINKIHYNEKDCTLITFIDVTTKKQIEEEKKRAELAETSNALLKAEIQERIKVENQLTLAQSYTNGIIESSIDMIYTAGINGTISEFNSAATKEFKYSKKEIIGKSLTILFANEKECNSVINELEENGQFVGEVVSKRKDNSVFISYLSVSYLFNTKGIVMGIMAISRDITELKLAEEELKKSEEKNKLQAAKLETIIESSSHYFFTVDKQHRIVSFNSNFRYDIESLTQKQVRENNDFFSIMNIEDKIERAKWERYFKIGFSGEHFYFENEQKDLNGNSHFREVFINPIKKEDGEIDELSFIGRDITEKKLADRNLKESLKQKEILLKEVHHRVKNNMQVISSILNLQSAYVKDVNTLQILKESQNRIKSMAFIHESLYTNEDFSRIDFSEYITNLVRNLFRTYDVFDDNITLDLKIDKIYLNLDAAIPCGLIVNELISNSLKYAFDVNSVGIIKIMLTLENDLVVLSIGDNGKGIPKDLDIENTETLGLQLISSLVEQLEGEMILNRDNGTHFIIKFKMV